MIGSRTRKWLGLFVVGGVLLLGEAGYKTVLSGKWHVGEAEGMRPQDVGFDEFYGYYSAQKELTQAFDKRRYPDLVLNPERLDMLRRTGASEALIHGFKNGETREVAQVDSVEAMAEADGMLKDFTVQKIGELARSDRPFFLEHCFMKVHADNGRSMREKVYVWTEKDLMAMRMYEYKIHIKIVQTLPSSARIEKGGWATSP